MASTHKKLHSNHQPSLEVRAQATGSKVESNYQSRQLDNIIADINKSVQLDV